MGRQSNDRALDLALTQVQIEKLGQDVMELAVAHLRKPYPVFVPCAREDSRLFRLSVWRDEKGSALQFFFGDPGRSTLDMLAGAMEIDADRVRAAAAEVFIDMFQADPEHFDVFAGWLPEAYRAKDAA